jgi:hypothetical protein
MLKGLSDWWKSKTPLTQAKREFESEGYNLKRKQWMLAYPFDSLYEKSLWFVYKNGEDRSTLSLSRLDPFGQLFYHTYTKSDPRAVEIAQRFAQHSEHFA